MKIWLAHHRHAFVSSLHRLATAPFATFFTLVSLGITLSLPAGLAAGLASLQQLADRLPAQGTLTVYIRTDASSDDRAALDRRVHALPGLASARFISRNDALHELSQHLGLPDLSAELPDNPLPDAWQLTPTRIDPALNREWSERLSHLAGVDLVLGDQVWVSRLNALVALGDRLTTFLAMLLAAGLVTISGNIIRLQILTRLPEIEVSQLIGATDRFIQRPFLYFGALQGLLSGVLAWGIVCIAIWLATPELGELARLYGSAFVLGYPTASAGLTLTAVAAALGWLGAWLALRYTLLR